MGVSKAQGPGRGLSFFFFKECCFRVRVRLELLLVSTLTLTLTLKQHSLKKRWTPTRVLLIAGVVGGGQ